MKKFLKISGISLLVILVVLVALPFLFKDKIQAMVMNELNKKLNAKVEVEDVSLSLFKQFPDFSLGLSNVIVVGTGDFANDTLLNLGEAKLRLDLMTVLKGEQIEIKQLDLDKASTKLIVHKDGKANWDIVKPDSTVSTEAEQPSKPFKLNLESYSFNAPVFSYDDQSMDFNLTVKDLNHEGSASIDGNTYKLNTENDFAQVSMSYGGVPMLSQVHLKGDLPLEMNMNNFSFKFAPTDLSLNDLKLNFGGNLAMPGDSIEMDIQAKAPKGNFKQLASLVPALYQKDFSSIDAKGNFNFDLAIKGFYSDVLMPAIKASLQVSDGYLKYPELPKTLSQLNLALDFKTEGGVSHAMDFNLEKFHTLIGSDPIDARLRASSAGADTSFDGMLKGKIDLAGIKAFYPTKDEMSGVITSDVTFAGSVKDVMRSAYDKLKFSGKAEAVNLHYASDSLPYPVNVPIAQVEFSPEKISMKQLKTSLMGSNFEANGEMLQPMKYLFSDGLLNVNANVLADQIDVDKFMPAETTTTTASTSNKPAQPTKTEYFRLPKNVVAGLTTKVGKIKYGKYLFENVEGKVAVANQNAELKDAFFKTIGGNVKLYGSYLSEEKYTKPEFNFGMDLSGFDVKNSFNTFETVQKFAPVAEYAKGIFGTKINFKGSFADGFMPDLASLSGTGKLISDNLEVSGFPSLDKIASLIKIPNIKRIKPEDLNLSYTLHNGKFIVSPFKVKADDIDITIEGVTGLDQNIDYNLLFRIPKKYFGNQANTYLNELVKKASAQGINLANRDFVDVLVNMKGAFKNPTITTNLKDQLKAGADNVKSQVQAELERRKKELEAKAKAELEKAKQLAEQKKKELEAQARQEAERLRKEGELKLQAEKDRLKQQAIDQQKALEQKAKEEAQKLKNQGKEQLKGVLKRGLGQPDTTRR